MFVSVGYGFKRAAPGPFSGGRRGGSGVGASAVSVRGMHRGEWLSHKARPQQLPPESVRRSLEMVQERRQPRSAKAPAPQGAVNRQEASAAPLEALDYATVPRYTSLEGNSSVLEIGSLRVFIDPVLVGPLVFFHPMVFKQRKPSMFVEPAPTPEQTRQRLERQFGPVGCVLLTQSLPDHAHPPTLDCIPRDTEIVAVESARPLLERMRFDRVDFLKEGEASWIYCGPPDQPESEWVEFWAVPGAVVGPPWQAPENGYVIRHWKQGEKRNQRTCLFRMLYEPHGYVNVDFAREVLADTADAAGRLTDVVLTPPLSVYVAGVYPLLSGARAAARLTQTLKPYTVIALRNWEGQQSGLLASLVSARGSLDEFHNAVTAAAARAQCNTRVLVPDAGKPYLLGGKENARDRP
ncbi:hypothetical protein CDCA_CDCA08G2376 [Cyanidium caldarium]|uniref:Metallo-beta-lactamase domain-containing protein n=1 Tax=Cyanidium caldarium TaxID=2771 RepID=A0AAV9IWB4_CYACA|nr:hypothetical protein CDCA_CDCA08G2376 [Cyanidium caldarium]